jgi:hypothetical protein
VGIPCYLNKQQAMYNPKLDFLSINFDPALALAADDSKLTLPDPSVSLPGWLNLIRKRQSLFRSIHCGLTRIIPDQQSGTDLTSIWA